MTDFRTIVALVCQATSNDDDARQIITAMTQWADTITAEANDPEAATTDPETARTVMDELLTAFKNEGRATVGTRDFMAHQDRIGRSRPWISGQIAQWLGAGRLSETTDAGRYRIA